MSKLIWRLRGFLRISELQIIRIIEKSRNSLLKVGPNLRRYFQFSPNLKKPSEITVPELFKLNLKVVGQ